MKYGRQLQSALDRLDESLARLHTMVKRGEQKAALRFMEEGELKERYEELQNIITISQTGTMGARGTGRVGNI
jgi:division protein CdvB (Snf7/Vps24/ESCRT-III family)